MGLGADLNVPNTIPLRARSVTMNFAGQPLDGRLSLLVGDDGILVDSRLGVSGLGSPGRRRQAPAPRARKPRPQQVAYREQDCRAAVHAGHPEESIPAFMGTRRGRRPAHRRRLRTADPYREPKSNVSDAAGAYWYQTKPKLLRLDTVGRAAGADK